MKLFKPKYLGLLFLLLGIVSCKKDYKITPQERDWLMEQDSLVVSLFPYYPPYQFMNKQGMIDGVFVDYLELLEHKMGYQFKRVTYTNWSQLMEDAKAGKVDVLLEIQPTKERLNYLNFYDLKFKSSQAIVVRKGEGLGKQMSQYHGKTISLPKGYAIVETVKRKHPKIKIVEQDSDSICLKLLNEGKFDAFIGPRVVVNHYQKVERLNHIEIIGNTPYNYKPDIAVWKENAMLNSIFEKANASITKREKKRILSNWLFNEVTPFYATSEFWMKLFLFGLFIVLCIGAFNRYLKFKVDQQTKELKLAKEKAVESNVLKGQFIQNISHEIRTPLNAILGFSELVRQPKISEEKIKRYTSNIGYSATRLTGVVDTILEVATLQGQQPSNTIDYINIKTLLEDVVNENKEKARHKKLSIKLLYNNYFPDAIVGVDQEKLKMTLNQVVDNAIKFTEKGAVVLAYEILDKNLKIVIKDTGIGITTNNEQIIFTSFAQLQHEISKKYSGLGLGLTIARENILLMKGTINYVSKVDQGSVFTITLPYLSKPIEHE